MTTKILVATLGNFLSLLALMKLLITLNKGDLIYNILALSGIVILLSVVVKTRLFTKFNFKTKTNEKNS
jgi:hypothetical protein